MQSSCYKCYCCGFVQSLNFFHRNIFIDIEGLLLAVQWRIDMLSKIGIIGQ